MKSLLISFFLVVSCANASESANIKLKICRYSGIQDVDDKKSIQIPGGSRFSGLPDREGNPSTKVVIKTETQATIPPKPGCVVTSVSVLKNPDNVTFPTKNVLKFGYGEMQVSGNPRIPDLQATIVK